MDENLSTDVDTFAVERVGNCSRCGGDHLYLTFKRFVRPIEDPDGTLWEWWTPCPTNGDPILLCQMDKAGSDALAHMGTIRPNATVLDEPDQPDR